MENDDSLPDLTDIEFDIPTLMPSILGYPMEPLKTFRSPPSVTIPSNPASPDAQPDSVSTAQGLSSFTVCSTRTVTTDQLQSPTISSVAGDARAKISSSRNARAQSKRRLRSMQRHASKDNKSLRFVRQHEREHFARLARVVQCPRFNPNLHYSLRPEYSSRNLLFWDNYRQEFILQNTLLPSQQLVVPLRAITANLRQKISNCCSFFSYFCLI